MKNNRTVNLETGGTATFTQRGKDPNVGFIRVDGRTISGVRYGDTFYANLWSPNADLVTPSGFLR